MGAPNGQRMLAGVGAPMGGQPVGPARGGWQDGPWQGAGPVSPPMAQYGRQPGDWEEGFGPRAGAGQPEYAAQGGGRRQPGRNLPATWHEAGEPEVRVWQER
jgi:hypothetical protein